MWAKLFFWAFVVFMELNIFVQTERPKPGDTPYDRVLLLVLWPIMALAIRKLVRWRYVVKHTVFVKRLD